MPILPMLAFSDAVWQAIIAALLAAYIAWINQRTRNAVANVEEKIVKIDEKVDVIHDLSNSAMGTQKRLLRDSTALRAQSTNLEVDIRAAFEAETDLREHEARQTAADVTKSKQ